MNQDLEPQIFSSNVAIHTSSAPEKYGDGSLEVQGRIYTDRVVEYTPSTGVDIEGIVARANTLLLSPITAGSVQSPTTGKAVVFQDETSGRVRVKYDGGYMVPIVQNKGDLLTHDGATEVILTAGATDGYHLVVDSTAPAGIAWKPVASNTTIESAYKYTTSPPETSTNATTYVNKKTWTLALDAGTYRFGIFYNWRTSSVNAVFRCKVTTNTNETLYTQEQVPSGNPQGQKYTAVGTTTITAPSNGNYTFTLQFCTNTNSFSAFISNVYMELLNVGAP